MAGSAEQLKPHKQQESWKPRVRFTDFPLHPNSFIVAARMIHDPEKGRVRNFLGRIFRDDLKPVLLSGRMPFKQAQEQARTYPDQYLEDEKGRKVEIFVYQQDIFTVFKDSEKIRKEQLIEAFDRDLQLRLDIAIMEASIHWLAEATSTMSRLKPER